MASKITHLYKTKSGCRVYGATFRETKKYLYIDSSGPSQHMKNFGYALHALTGENFTLYPVTISGVDPFGHVQETKTRGLSNLTTRIPKILFAYNESYQAIVDCCQQYF